MRRSNILLLALAMLCLAAPGLRAEGRVVILDYHSFLGAKDSSLDYTLEAVAKQLDRLSALGYRFVTLEDALAGRIQGGNNLVLTIDDGNHSVYQAFKQVFEPRGIKPFLFVYPAPVGKDRRFLTPAQLSELAAAGCGVGAHGYYHERMSRSAWRQDRAKVEAEIRRPGPALEKLLGSRPRLFAYPFGADAPEEGPLLKEEGYDFAFLAGEETRPVDFADPTLDRYNVPRVIVYHWNFPLIVKALAAFAARAGDYGAGPRLAYAPEFRSSLVVAR